MNGARWPEHSPPFDAIDQDRAVGAIASALADGADVDAINEWGWAKFFKQPAAMEALSPYR